MVPLSIFLIKSYFFLVVILGYSYQNHRISASIKPIAANGKAHCAGIDNAHAYETYQ